MTFLKQYKHYIIATILVLLALFMFIKGSDYQALSNLNNQTIKSLDNTKVTALKLSATATAASTLITIIPGDVGMPVAENLADIGDYLLIVVASIWLQKFLIGVTGLIALKYLIPISLLSFVGFIFTKKEFLFRLALKLGLFAIFLFGVVPSSVALSNYIEHNYQDSVQKTLDKAEKENKKIDQSESESKNFWDSLTSGVKKLTSQTVVKFQAVLNNMIDAAAVLIVTTCVIPILVLMSFLWVIKFIFGLTIDTDITQFSLVGRSIRKINKHKKKTQLQ